MLRVIFNVQRINNKWLNCVVKRFEMEIFYNSDDINILFAERTPVNCLFQWILYIKKFYGCFIQDSFFDFLFSDP